MEPKQKNPELVEALERLGNALAEVNIAAQLARRELPSELEDFNALAVPYSTLSLMATVAFQQMEVVRHMLREEMAR